MRKVNYLLILFLTSLFLNTGCSSTRPAKLAMRQIDRPLIPPKGTWEVFQTGFAYIRNTFPTEVNFFPFLYLAMPFPISHSITNRFYMTNVILPLHFSYAVVHQTEITQDTMYLRGLDFVLDGGIRNFEYSTSNGLILQHSYGARLKCSLWQKHYILANTEAMFKGFEYFNSKFGFGIGSQITKTISSEIESFGGYGHPYVTFFYVPSLSSLDSYPYIGGNAALKCDFGSHIGFDISLIGHYVFQVEYFELFPNISLRVNW